MFRNSRQSKGIDISVPQLDPAIQLDAWEFLNSEAPYYATCVANAVAAGHSPEKIFDYMVRSTMRPQIALRCKQAAQYLINQDISS